MGAERVVLALIGERIDGVGSISQPLRHGTFDEALDCWQRLQRPLTEPSVWRWSIDARYAASSSASASK